MEKLKERFGAAIDDICAESHKINYFPTRFEGMVRDLGAHATARKLLTSEPEQDGLQKLWSLGRLDLSLECVVLKPEFRPLFNDEELEVARWRLRERGFNPALCEGA